MKEELKGPKVENVAIAVVQLMNEENEKEFKSIQTYKSQ